MERFARIATATAAVLVASTLAGVTVYRAAVGAAYERFVEDGERARLPTLKGETIGEIDCHDGGLFIKTGGGFRLYVRVIDGRIDLDPMGEWPGGWTPVAEPEGEQDGTQGESDGM